MQDLVGRTALITGASRGLGAEVAQRLAAAGMQVALAARHAEDLERVAHGIRKAGGTALPCPLDVRDRGQIVGCVERVLAHFGQIDVLINNAGLSWYKPLHEWSSEEIEQVLTVNLNGLIHMTHAVLPHFLARRSGQIVNIASDIGRRVIPNMAPYVAAKHGVVGFSGSLLREVKDQGIRVMLVLPGTIDTYFGGGKPGERDPSWALDPAHVAEVIHGLLTQPAGVVLDEVAIHPLGQEF